MQLRAAPQPATILVPLRSDLRRCVARQRQRTGFLQQIAQTLPTMFHLHQTTLIRHQKPIRLDHTPD